MSECYILCYNVKKYCRCQGDTVLIFGQYLDTAARNSELVLTPEFCFCQILHYRIRNYYSYQFHILSGDVQTIPNSADVVKQIREDVKQNVELVNMIMLQVKRIISLSVLIIVVQSYLYLRGIISTDNHDNLYITPLFVEVDEKRKKKGRCVQL